MSQVAHLSVQGHVMCLIMLSGVNNIGRLGQAGPIIEQNPVVKIVSEGLMSVRARVDL